MSLALLIPGVGMGGSEVVFSFPARGVAGTADFGYEAILPDTVIFPDDVIYPDGILGRRGSTRTPGSAGPRGTTSSAIAGSGRQ